MVRVLGAVLLLGFLSTNATSDTTSTPAEEVPELIVSLALAEGFVPLEESDHVPYRFRVLALAPEGRRGGSSEVLLRLGQKRDLKPGPIRGSVHLREDGLATYRAELVVDGKIVARTRATVKVKTSN